MFIVVVVVVFFFFFFFWGGGGHIAYPYKPRSFCDFDYKNTICDFTSFSSFRHKQRLVYYACFRPKMVNFDTVGISDNFLLTLIMLSV